jgi:hypothetical protein
VDDEKWPLSPYIPIWRVTHVGAGRRSHDAKTPGMTLFCEEMSHNGEI